MKTTQSQRKSNAKNWIPELEIEKGNYVFMRFFCHRVLYDSKEKKSRHIRPFEILEKVGMVAYWVALPPSLSIGHNVFHITMLREYERDPSNTLDYEPMELKKNWRMLNDRFRYWTGRKKCSKLKQSRSLKCYGGTILLRSNMEWKEEIWERYPQIFYE